MLNNTKTKRLRVSLRVDVAGMEGKRIGLTPGDLLSETVVTTNQKKSAEVIVVRKFL